MLQTDNKTHELCYKLIPLHLQGESSVKGRQYVDTLLNWTNKG